jgi:hypothetical protein
VTGFRPTGNQRAARVEREALYIEDVDDELLREEAAVDAGNRSEEPIAITQLRRDVAAEPAAKAAPPTGLPPEQLYTWLEWVQDDLRRLESRLQYLESARSQLREQERLLSELLQTSKPLNRS